MTQEERIQNACDELHALGKYWKSDWSEFDGRTLECQLNTIVGILKNGQKSIKFQKMLEEQEHDY
jgi:hypothetical protein